MFCGIPWSAAMGGGTIGGTPGYLTRVIRHGTATRPGLEGRGAKALAKSSRSQHDDNLYSNGQLSLGFVPDEEPVAQAAPTQELPTPAAPSPIVQDDAEMPDEPSWLSEAPAPEFTPPVDTLMNRSPRLPSAPSPIRPIRTRPRASPPG